MGSYRIWEGTGRAAPDGQTVPEWLLAADSWLPCWSYVEISVR